MEIGVRHGGLRVGHGFETCTQEFVKRSEQNPFSFCVPNNDEYLYHGLKR